MSGQRYLVTARKYRPQTFDDLVAQEHVAETLKNALRLDRLAHAYLFSGPRGVGKTTAARILAKAINCTTPASDRPEGVEPCRTCDSCRAFEEGRSLSIFEIDAASNNKVEDIRELRETVRIPPQGSRKKVYIIDEVHMLSNAAFNALLKTLEEPPPHVLFIFATTEPHKVLPTILSRCQRFDFRRIPVPDIVQRLQSICASEDITADEASLMLIARKGDGALRDSLSVFDQSISLCGSDLHYAELAQALGVVDVDLFFEVTSNILGNDSAGMLRLVDRIVRAGHDLQEFLGGLAEHIRNLLVGSTTGEAALIEATDTLRHRYLEESARFPEADLLRLLSITSDTEGAIRSSSQPRLKVELALLKMASLTRTTDLRAVLDQLKSMPAGALAESAPPASSAAQAPRPKPAPEEGKSRDDEGGVAVVKPVRPPLTPPAGPAREKPAAPAPPPEPASEGAVDVRTKVFKKPALSVRREGGNPDPSAVDAGSGDGAASSVEVVAPSVPAEELNQIWATLVERLTGDRPRLVAMVRQAVPASLSAGLLTVSVPNELCKGALQSDSESVRQELRAVCTHTIKEIRYEIDAALTPRHLEETGPEVDPYEYLQKKRAENPVLQVLFDEFGGEIVS